AEDQGGCGAVEEEVVPLDRGADKAGQHHAPDRRRVTSIVSQKRTPVQEASRSFLDPRTRGTAHFCLYPEHDSQRREIPLSDSTVPVYNTCTALRKTPCAAHQVNCRRPFPE